MNKAKFVSQVTVIDPDSMGEVEISVYKHENGGMFGVDSSFIEQNFEDDEPVIIPDPIDFISFDKEDMTGRDTTFVLLEE